MATHRVMKKLAKIINRAPASVAKTRRKSKFQLVDIKAIYEYFKQFKPDITIEYIFENDIKLSIYIGGNVS